MHSGRGACSSCSQKKVLEEKRKDVVEGVVEAALEVATAGEY